MFVVQTLLTSKTILRSFADAPPCVRVCLVSGLWHGQVRFLSLRSLDGLCIRSLVYPFSYASICPSIYSPSDLCGVHYLHHRCVFSLCLPCSYRTHNPLAHITVVSAHGCPTHHPHMIPQRYVPGILACQISSHGMSLNPIGIVPGESMHCVD